MKLRICKYEMALKLRNHLFQNHINLHEHEHDFDI